MIAEKKETACRRKNGKQGLKGAVLKQAGLRVSSGLDNIRGPMWLKGFRCLARAESNIGQLKCKNIKH